jgi:hypothetical protein
MGSKARGFSAIHLSAARDGSPLPGTRNQPDMASKNEGVCCGNKQRNDQIDATPERHVGSLRILYISSVRSR